MNPLEEAQHLVSARLSRTACEDESASQAVYQLEGYGPRWHPGWNLKAHSLGSEETLQGALELKKGALEAGWKTVCILIKGQIVEPPCWAGLKYPR